MNELLKQFFRKEREKVFVPSPLFAQRVLSILGKRSSTDAGIWDMVPHAARSVFTLAIGLILCFVVLEMVIPMIPEREMLEAYLESEQSVTETVLYSDSEVPAGQDFLELIAVEDQR